MTLTRPVSGSLPRRSVIAGALGLMLLSACGGKDGASDKKPVDEPRALTSKEAELLALARVRLHRAETVPVVMEWPGEPSAELTVTLDLHGSLAWGRMKSEETERLLLWNLEAVGTAPDGAEVPELEAWAIRSISTEVPQDIFLTLALTLGSDRPENPVLLQQSTAQFLRRDEVEGTPVSVLQGPRPADEEESRESRSRYWIDDEGALLRFEAYLGDPAGRFARLTVTAPHDEVEGLREAAPKVLVARGAGSR